MELMTLKLDSSYKPVGIVSWRDALTLVITEKAYAVELYETYVHSAREIFQLPSVIALRRFVDFSFLRPSCTRKNIIFRDDFTCQYCYKKFPVEELNMDHVVPRSRGGEKSWENIVCSCKGCNQKKGNRTPEEAGMKLLKKPRPLSNLKVLKKRSGNINKKWKNYLDIHGAVQ
jgi:5-methylcytosine-specific restriction endonuclease McrA